MSTLKFLSDVWSGIRANDNFELFTTILLLQIGHLLAIVRQNRKDAGERRAWENTERALRKAADDAERDKAISGSEVKRLTEDLHALRDDNARLQASDPRQECLRDALKPLRNLIADFEFALKDPRTALHFPKEDYFVDFSVKAGVLICKLVNPLCPEFSNAEAEAIGWHLSGVATSCAHSENADHKPLQEAIDALLAGGAGAVIASSCFVPPEWRREMMERMSGYVYRTPFGRPKQSPPRRNANTSQAHADRIARSRRRKSRIDPQP